MATQAQKWIIMTPWHDLLGSPRVILNDKIFLITQIPANMKIVTYKTFYDISFFEDREIVSCWVLQLNQKI